MSIVEIVLSILLSLMFGWTFYNLPAFFVGVKSVKKREKTFEEWSGKVNLDYFPFFSLIVPMKNEEKVAGRILDVLLKLNYPPDRYEVIVVDDRSTDGTSKVCREFESAYPGRMRYFRREISRGKPSALNYGLKFARGEVIGVFDADNVPDPHVLLNTAKYFRDYNVVAVQGLLSSINTDENMLTKITSYEQIIQHYVLSLGKDKLGLFVPLAGTCQFVRRDVLENVGGWAEEALCEDTDLSAKLTEKGYYVKFAPEVKCWQESPSNFSQLIGQRVRWFRGCMEVSVKYGRLLKRVERRSLDAEAYFFGPFLMLLALGTYFLGLYEVFVPFNLGTYVYVLSQTAFFLTLFTLSILGVGLAYATKPRKISNVKWLPFIYLYWSIQVFVALYAFLQIILRRRREWTKTSRTGVVTEPKIASLYAERSSR